MWLWFFRNRNFQYIYIGLVPFLGTLTEIAFVKEESDKRTCYSQHKTRKSNFLANYEDKDSCVFTLQEICLYVCGQVVKLQRYTLKKESRPKSTSLVQEVWDQKSQSCKMAIFTPHTFSLAHLPAKLIHLQPLKFLRKSKCEISTSFEPYEKRYTYIVVKVLPAMLSSYMPLHILWQLC